MLHVVCTVLIALWLGLGVSGPWTGQVASTPEEHTLDDNALAIAWIDDVRLLVLAPQRVSLLRLEAGRQQELASVELPGPFLPVRKNAGMIALAAESRDAWVLTNSMARAVLVGVEQDRLVLGATADAIPWPGLPGGIRYREGTNVLQGVVPEENPQRLIGLAPGRSDIAVDDDGELLALAPGAAHVEEGIRVGPVLAGLGSDDIIASSADPPGDHDTLVLVHRDGDEWTTRRCLTVSGAVTALAARLAAGRAHVACACSLPGGTAWTLLTFDVDIESR
jgi:hypothetical protein